MHPAYPNPFLMAHGEAQTNGAGGVFGAVSLYNDASAPCYLAVWNWWEPSANASGFAGFFFKNGKVGATPVQGLPIIPDEPAKPGQITFGNVAALPTTGAYSYGSPNVNSPVWYPFAVISQGYSLTFYALAQATVLAIGFLWEAVHPDEFRARYTLQQVGHVVPGTP